ncbi:sensor histidine kinase [Nocardia terrae]|nr:sensor histidine kinase [Nocardia terrae]
MRSSLSARVSALLDRVAGVNASGPSRTRKGVFSSAMATLWLVWLYAPLHEIWREGHHLRAGLGGATVVLFGLLVVAAFIVFWQPDSDDEPPRPAPAKSRVWLLLGIMSVVAVVLMLLAGATAVPVFIYVGVVASIMLPSRQSAAAVGLVVVIMLGTTVLIVGMHGPPFYLAFIPLVVWLLREVGKRGQRLQATARQHRAELAIIEERNRVARDVHDILGHSLTVITVKTELAQRLLELDPERARAEMADVERLAREALAGVRSTVGGLREVSLPGELANARTALRAAEIEAELPESGDLPIRHGVVFGWVLREAVTNVVRHSGAEHCWVRVTPTSLEVSDDGVGMADAAQNGSGLSGLHERVRATGGTLTLANRPEGGLRVLASFPETTKEPE